MFVFKQGSHNLKLSFDYRYSDKHNCTFNYKALGKSEIAEANPVITPKKIAKI